MNSSKYVDKDSKELEDLEADTTAHNMSSKKMFAKRGTHTTTSNSKSNPNKVVIVGNVTLSLESTLIANDPNFSCTYMLPCSPNKAKEGVKNGMLLEFQRINLSTSFLRVVKVLPGGMKFAICIASPK